MGEVGAHNIFHGSSITVVGYHGYWRGSANSNNLLLSVARLRRLSKDFKTLESYIAATCESEFCSVGLLQKAIRRRFEESLL